MKGSGKKWYPEKRCNMKGYQEICLILVLVSFSPAILERNLPEHEDAPTYRLTFENRFNMSGPGPVDGVCGRYVATTFLTEFLKMQNFFQNECRRDVPAANRVRVRVHHVAMVRLLGHVELTTYMNISLEGEHSGKEDLLQCAALLNNTLHNTSVVSSSTFGSGIFHIPESKNCSTAWMDPTRFIYKEAKWVCGINITYDATRWRCVDDIEPPTGPSSSKNGVTTSGLASPWDDTTITPSSEVFRTNTAVDPENETRDSIATSKTSGVDSGSTLKQLTSDDGYTTATDSMDSSAFSSATTFISPTTGFAANPDIWSLKVIDDHSVINVAEGQQQILNLDVWANRSLLCGDQPVICSLSVDISFFPGSVPEPMKTRKKIPQLVVGSPQWGGGPSYCSIALPAHMDRPRRNKIAIKAKLDGKYDGLQVRYLALSLTRTLGSAENVSVLQETVYQIPVSVHDRDKKATCKSINDPHLTTFDGVEYNNFYEGEFVLYRHKTLPFSVHTIFQRCGGNIMASCNCAVAVQSGDDVVVIERCYRRKKFKRLEGRAKSVTVMNTDLYLNGQLTPGTQIFEVADGKKYYIYLPHGAYVKVMVSGMLINVWIVASPSDLGQTEGLCGTYDWIPNNDITLRNGSTVEEEEVKDGRRGQPRTFSLEWRVDLYGKGSTFHGVEASRRPYTPERYCECDQDQQHDKCGFGVDINTCDIYQGKEVTDWFVSHAKKPIIKLDRRRRDIADNSISPIPDEEPIVIEKKFVPPKYKWKSGWNEVRAKTYCVDYIRNNYSLGQLCAQLPNINFKQEVDTCAEDIQITGNTTWADSARDALKEQCLEEIQRNGSLPRDIADRIESSICVNDCSTHGYCINGTCQCDVEYSSADCSVPSHQPPYSTEMPRYGLCDLRYMKCDHAIVYGEDFINGDNLTCHLQECEVSEDSFIRLPTKIKLKGLFLNFNAVECPIPVVRSYLVSVSNDGIHPSDSLLFIPFDSVCNECSTESRRCSKRRNSCIIDGRCYKSGELSPNNTCLKCHPFGNELQWTSIDTGATCRSNWWDSVSLPNWAVAIPAALAGSLVGVLVGFLLYKCCCKGRKTTRASIGYIDSNEGNNSTPFEDVMLHRNRGLPDLNNDRFNNVNHRQPNYEERFFFNDGRGVENGVDSTTYF